MKDGVVLEYIHFHHFQCRTESLMYRKFNVDLRNTLSAFKAARIMCPVTV